MSPFPVSSITREDEAIMVKVASVFILTDRLNKACPSLFDTKKRETKLDRLNIFDGEREAQVYQTCSEKGRIHIYAWGMNK